MSEGPRHDLSSYRARDILADRRLTDTVFPPIVFVVANGLIGLVPAAVAAVSTAVVICFARAIRREEPINAIGGIFATAVAVGIALLSGRAEDYFWPRVFSNAFFALLLATSIAARRPAVGLVSQAVYRFPTEWLAHPRVRRAYAEITWAWVGLCLLRAVTYVLLIEAGEVGWLAAASFVLGWPCFAALLIGSYAYVRWRLPRLGAPDPNDFVVSPPPPSPAPR